MSLREEWRAQGEFLFRHRSYLPLVGVAAYVLGLPQSEWIEQTYGDFVDDVFDWLCIVLSGAGLSLRFYVSGTVPPRTSGRNTRKGQVADHLNSTGAYSAVRHPLYLGNLLVFAGICLAPGVPWLLAGGLAAFCLYYERIAFAEEEFLRERFGHAFETWAARTPAFVPDWRGFRPASLAFCVRTAIRREYQTIAATAIAFCVVDYAEDLVWRGPTGMLWEPETTALAVAASVFALSVRWLRKRTRLLHVEGR